VVFRLSKLAPSISHGAHGSIQHGEQLGRAEALQAQMFRGRAKAGKVW
jgi:hypothetical protein